LVIASLTAQSERAVLRAHLHSPAEVCNVSRLPAAHGKRLEEQFGYRLERESLSGDDSGAIHKHPARMKMVDATAHTTVATALSGWAQSVAPFKLSESAKH
jgi:hypothetical protein